MADYPRMLYELKDFFRLTYGGQPYYIEEPQGWDKVSIKFTRDKDLYGFNYEFVDPQVTLLFSLKQGGSLIKGAYNLAGSDAEVIFDCGYEKQGEKILQYSGRLNFNTYKVLEAGIELQVEKVMFDSLLRTRYETKVSLASTKDLNGMALPATPSIDLSLHSKILTKTGRSENLPRAEQPISGPASNYGRVYIQPDTQSLVLTEVEEMQSMPGYAGHISPEIEKRFQFIAKENGYCTFTFNGYMSLRFGTYTYQQKQYFITPHIMVVRNNAILYNYTDPTANKRYDYLGSQKDTMHSFIISTGYDIKENDEVYFYTEITSTTGGEVYLLWWEGSIDVAQQTISNPSTCTGYRIFDALNGVVARITGAGNSVVSSFFQTGGCGEKYFLTNGFKLRRFSEERPVQMSFKDLIEGASAIWNIGLQYTKDADGISKIRIERADYFFGSKRIMDFEYLESLEEAHEKEVTYNEVEIGYTKFSEEEVNTLEEFATTQTWLMPISTYKSRYIKKCNFIASGSLIEKSRREQFSKSPSKSMSNDDDIFIISYWNRETFSFFGFNVSGSSLNAEWNLNLVPGEQFRIGYFVGGYGTSVEQDSTVYTVVSGSGGNYQVTPNFPTPRSGYAQLTMISPKLAAETNEPFYHVRGITSPESAYNLRLSPKHMLYNHSSQLRICLAKKPGAELIRNTYAKSNLGLETGFHLYAPCQLLPSNYPPIKEIGDISLSDPNFAKAPYLPTSVTFRTEIRYDQIMTLKERLLGESGTDEDYGMIGWKDHDGVWWEGYVWSLEYQPANKQATFNVRVKGRII